MRDFRRCKEAEELGREAQQQANRQLKWYYDEGGMLVIKARLPAEAGQMFIKAIQAASEDVSEPKIPYPNVSAETPKDVSGASVSAETPTAPMATSTSSTCGQVNFPHLTRL